MNIKCDKFNIFYGIFLLYFVPSFLEYTMFVAYDILNFVFDISKTISYILIIIFLGIKYCKMDKVYIKYAILILVYFVYLLCQSFFGNDRAIFVVFIFSLAFDVKHSDKFLKRTLNVSIFLYIVTILCCCMGIIDNVKTDFHKLGIKTYRYACGFNYPGQMMMSLMPIVLMYFYVNKKTTLKSIVWLIIDVLVFVFSKTVTSFVVILLFIILCNFSKNKENKCNCRIKKSKLEYLPYACFFVTLILLWLQSKGTVIGHYIDIVVNGRFNLGNIFIDMFGIKLFGTDFINSTEHYYQIIDSDYVYMLVAGGIIYLIIALEFMKDCLNYKKNESIWCIIWGLLSINAIVNNGVFNYVFNPFCIFLVPAIKNKVLKQHFLFCRYKN